MKIKISVLLTYLFVIGISLSFSSLSQAQNTYTFDKFLPGTFSIPFGLGVDNQDNVYIANSGNHIIQKFDSNGNYISSWGGPSWGIGPGEFKSPGHRQGVTS